MASIPMPSNVETVAGSERRLTMRYPFTASAEVFEPRSQTRVTGRSSDLGLGGCFIDTTSPLAAGTSVRVRLTREERSFEAMASVSYVLLSMGMGLVFTDIKPEDKPVLRDWIEEVSGEALPAPHEMTSLELDARSTSANLYRVISELIALIADKQLISEDEAGELLQHLVR